MVSSTIGAAPAGACKPDMAFVQPAWPQQHCVVMLVPTEQVQGCYSAAWQQQPFAYSPVPQAIFQPTEQLQHYDYGPAAVNYDYSPSFQAGYGSETTQRDFLEQEEQQPHTSSAARRLRRKRAQERAATEVSTIQPAFAGAAAFSDEMCEALKLQLESGDRVEDAVATLRGQVWRLSRHPVGCRAVQLALERCAGREASELAAELRGHVLEAATSPHANYVLQKVITQLSSASSKFVAEELLGSAARIARHRFGCRILCRLVEFYAARDTTQHLLDELLAEAGDLCCHAFGHHVAQCMLEHGSDQQRQCLAAALGGNAMAFATNRHATYLIEAVLDYCGDEDQASLLHQLAHPATIASLALHPFGCFVSRTLLQHAKVDTESALAQIRAIKGQLEQMKHGQRFLEELGFAVPRSDISDVMSEGSE